MGKFSEKVILVPFGSTKDAMIAVEQSYNLANLSKAKLVLLGVSTSRHPFDQKQFDKVVEDVKAKGEVPVETMVRKGNIYDELTKVADIINPMFIVMRIRESLGPDKLIGRNIFKMVRQSKHAVITLKGDTFNSGCERILLPLDLSKESREKVDKAIHLAKLFEAEIDVVCVSQSKTEVTKLESYMRQAEKVIKDSGVKCDTHMLRGKDIPSTIINHAHTVNADLIVIMTQEKIHLSEMTLWNMGTVAQQLINESDIPVLSFRPMKRKDTSVGITPY